jgi:hypothetical protein
MSGSISPNGILSIGFKHQVMQSRSAVLRSKGYIVFECFAVDSGMESFQSIDVIDLAILCHSIPCLQQCKLARDMKSIRPLTPIVALVRGFARVEAADVSLESLSGPEELLDCVGSLLEKGQFGMSGPSQLRPAPHAGERHNDSHKRR